ncbi:MAG: SGNH/GDSL hydrolase family protein [Bdellovibrionaceae bacterium]|nr:SGNH/GDSL hydrolase family protein [Bdellovibrio sp.]
MKLFNSIFFTLFFSISVFATQSRFTRALVFGDSLSDVGTYSPWAGTKGGGKFVTNPGQLWIEIVAGYLGLPMKERAHEGYGIPYTYIGGFNFAQGGARISLPGEVVMTSDQVPLKFSARSLADQVNVFFADKKLAPLSENDLVFIQGGANDIILQLDVAYAKNGLEKIVPKIQKAADDLVKLIVKLQTAGAKNIAIQNLPMVHKAPRFINLPAAKNQIVATLVQTFNTRLAEGLVDKDVLLIDMYSFDQTFNDNYVQLGFENVTQPACRLKDLMGGLALFCTGQTLVKDGADMTYKFSDDVHPSTGYSKVIGDLFWVGLRAKYGFE